MPKFDDQKINENMKGKNSNVIENGLEVEGKAMDNFFILQNMDFIINPLKLRFTNILFRLITFHRPQLPSFFMNTLPYF